MRARPPDNHPPRLSATRRPWWRHWWLLVYIVVLPASHAWETWLRDRSPEPIDGQTVTIAKTNRSGPVPERGEMRIAFSRWDPTRESKGAPILLLHGSPGDRGNFEDNPVTPGLGSLLASRGRTVIAPDLPGFGDSEALVPDYSFAAHAQALLLLLDELDIQEAHVVAWSQGGGAALLLADEAPERILSVSLVSSIGVQEQEGSGSYWFEHFKYAVGYATLVVAWDVLAPDFGLFQRDGRRAFIRSFWDSDQRDLRPVMEDLQTPVLILHGRDDFLTSYQTALESHAILPRSSLVSFNASHFLPFSHGGEVAGLIAQHALSAEQGMWIGPEEPVPARVKRPLPWWLAVLVIAPFAAARRTITAVVCAVLVATVKLDFGVAWVGLALGQLGEAVALRWAGARLGAQERGSEDDGSPSRWRRVLRRIGWDVTELADSARQADWRRRAGRLPFTAPFVARFIPGRARESAASSGATKSSALWHYVATVLAVVLWTSLALTFARILAIMTFIPLHSQYGVAGGVVGVLFLILAVRFIERMVTWEGRGRLRAMIGRVARYEFWPWWIFYAPVVPWMVVQAIRRGGPLVFTCVNPGIGSGGGVVGESKTQIQSALAQAGAPILPSCPIEGGPAEERARRVEQLLELQADLGGWPAILKPDSSQRGFAVRLVRTPQDVLSYFQSMTRRAIVQRYHPGPFEAGVLWTRYPDGPREGRAGFVFSITRKEFQRIEGDGVHTLEELVYRHDRYRCQWRVYLSRFAADRSRVLDEGEQLRLAVAGNHSQGTLFADGSDLKTPELEEAIDRFCARFRGVGDGELDWTRMDLRYESDEALKRGERFAIVEMNGTMAESTNIYDPGRNVFWAYRTLLRQWSLLYKLGAMRRDKGNPGMRVPELLRAMRAHYLSRPGPSISD